MYCAKCGAENQSGMNFCEKCGAPLNIQAIKSAGHNGKRKQQIIIAGICAMILLACVIGVMVYIGNQKQAEYNTKIETADRYFQEMDYEKAETAYLEAIDIQPKEDDAYIKLSQVYVKQERYDEAIAILEKGQENAGGEDIREELRRLTEGDSQYQAYYDLCMQYRQKYGEAGFVSHGAEYGEIAGFSVARLVDFNDDGNQELLVAYSEDGVQTVGGSIKYEVWAWQDDELVNVFPATGVNHGTDVSGWISTINMDGTLHIYISKLSELYQNAFLYYDGNEFITRYEATENRWEEHLQENQYYIDGERVSESVYRGAIDEYALNDHFDMDTPYSNENGEFRIDFRSVTYNYANKVIAETNQTLETLRTERR